MKKKKKIDKWKSGQLPVGGNPKTLTPGPRTPLWTGSVDYPWTGPRTTPTDPFYGTPQNRVKIKNKYFTNLLYDRLFISAKF